LDENPLLHEGAKNIVFTPMNDEECGNISASQSQRIYKTACLSELVYRDESLQ
jgi:hypothetical protein